MAVRTTWLRRGQQVVATCWLHQPTEKVVPKNARGTIIKASLFGPFVVAFDVANRRHGRRVIEVRVARHLLQRTTEQATTRQDPFGDTGSPDAQP